MRSTAWLYDPIKKNQVLVKSLTTSSCFVVLFAFIDCSHWYDGPSLSQVACRFAGRRLIISKLIINHLTWHESVFTGHEFSRQKFIDCSVLHEIGDHQDGRWRHHQTETESRSDRQRRRGGPSAIGLDRRRYYPSRFFSFSSWLFLSLIGTDHLTIPKMILLALFVVELPNGLEIWWDGQSRSVELWWKMLCVAAVTNLCVWYRVYIDAPPTFFGTTKVSTALLQSRTKRP